jgi:hypothetical protein
MKKATVVEVMIVEVAVAKVDPGICGTLFTNNAAPSCLISRESLAGCAEPAVVRRLQIFDNGVDEILASNVITAYESVLIHQDTTTTYAISARRDLAASVPPQK